MTIYNNIKQLESVGQLHSNTLVNADCLEAMKFIADKSVDMVLCDLPYGQFGTTDCKWDNIIPFEPLWEQYERIIKDNGAIVLFGSEPFTSELVLSNKKLFKYSLIWKKTRPQGFAQAPYKFMSNHEDILVFSRGGCSKNSKIRMKFNPQGLIYNPKLTKGKKSHSSPHRIRVSDQKEYISYWTNYPRSVIEIDSEFKTVHPTQKPIKLIEYLIKTYSNDGDIILDNCMGSGSTGVSCVNTNRKFIGIELDEKYYDISCKRITDAINEKKQSLF